jgi:anti-anti-sigma factor
MPSNLFVSVQNQTAFIRIVGRANFTFSVNFKTLIQELHRQGCRCFVLDLSECLTMDSTFLGVMAGTALKIAEENGTENSSRLRLFNPTPRVADLLENLGVAHLFEIIQCAVPAANSFAPTENDGSAPSKAELSRTCLEAHQVLMAVNPENIPKFKEVAQFLAEDLKRANAADNPS